MPTTIAVFVANALVTSGIVGATGGVAVIGVVSGLVTGVVGLGISYAASLLFGPEEPQRKPSDQSTNIAEPVFPRQRHYGEVRIGGVVVFIESREEQLYKLVALSTDEVDSFVAYYINDELVTLDENGNVNEYKTKSEDREDRIVIATRRGVTPETAYQQLMDVFTEWTADHRGDGIASLLMVITQTLPEDQFEVFPNGASTQISPVVRTSRVFDPRTGATAYSDNVALCLRDYLISQWGLRLAETWVANAEADWITAANDCDDDIPLKAGGTEKRYRLALSYGMDERPIDVIRRQLSAMDGTIFPTPNKGFGVRAGKWREPTVTLDERDIAAFQNLTRGVDVTEETNTIRAQYLSPKHDYREQDSEPFFDQASILLNGDLDHDRGYLPVPSFGQCRRLQKIALHRFKAGWRAVIVTNLGGLAVLGEQFIRVRLADYGLDATFEIQNQPSFVMGDDGLTIKGLSIEIIAMGREAWDWDAASEEGTEPPVLEKIEYVPPVTEPPPPPVDLQYADGRFSWRTANDPSVYATRLYLAAFDETFEDAIEISGPDPIYIGPNEVARYDHDVDPGEWKFWATNETFRGTASVPSEPYQFEVLP